MMLQWAIVVLFCVAQGWLQNFAVDIRSLATEGENQYFILKPGYQTTFEDKEGAKSGKLVITVLNETLNVGGVDTRIVEEREWSGGELIEVSRNYFAISPKTGDVYYFGEDVLFRHPAAIRPIRRERIEAIDDRQNARANRNRFADDTPRVAGAVPVLVMAVLVGGLAVSVRTEPRFTRDVDLAVALASDAEAEALIRQLRAHDYRVEAVVEQDAVGRLATVRLTHSSEPQAPVIDLLFASSGIEPEVVAEAEPIELLPNLTMGVAMAGHLIALKVLSRDDVRRPQDLVDLRALLRVASPTELARARHSLALIAARGYDRGRDLISEIHTLLPLAP
jgi:hypothetical protein